MITGRTANLPNAALAGGVIALGTAAALLATNLSFSSSDSTSLHPLAAAVLMAGVAIVAVRWVAGEDTSLTVILAAGFAAKMIGMLARYQVSIKVYGGLYDAAFYHDSASQVSEWMRAEGFVPRSDPRVSFRESGTTNLAYSLGLLYYVTGARVLTAYVVAASMGYLGMLAFVKAGIEAVPGLDRHRFAALVVFLPTLVYWPSSLGKEAWMLCWLGVGALGVARVCRGSFGFKSLLPLIIGIGAAGWVRPHIAALMIAALVAALLWPTGFKGNRLRPVLALALASVALVFALGAVLSTFSRFTEADNSDFGAILEGTTDQTTQGGSEFAAQPVSGPVSLARAVVTVVFRPFPWEAGSGVQLLTSLEGFGLLALAVWSQKRIAAVPRAFIDNAYVRFALIYTVGFAFAYASIGNFGILARQRAQLFPVFMLLFALQPRASSTGAPQSLKVAKGTSTGDGEPPARVSARSVVRLD